MRFYYPLPDYKKPNVIFTDEQLPEYNSIGIYLILCRYSLFLMPL